MIVPGGGSALDGSKWAPCKLGFFVPVRVLSKLFRRLMLEELEAAQALRQLTFFGEHAGPARQRPLPCISHHFVRRTGSSTRSRRSPGPERCSPISPVTPPRCHLEPPTGRPRRGPRHVPIQGLPPEGAGAIPDHDPRARRFHPAPPAPRLPVGLHRIRHHGLLACATREENARTASRLSKSARGVGLRSPTRLVLTLARLKLWLNPRRSIKR